LITASLCARLLTISRLAFSSLALAQSGVPCPGLPGDPSSWKEQEHWVWNEVCSGREANLQQYGGNEAHELPENRPPQRELSGRFLRTILLDDIYRSRIPGKGVLIIGARFREKIDLSHAKLEHDLWLRWSRFEGTPGSDESLNLVGTEISGHLNLDHSIFLKHVNMDSTRATALSLTNGNFPSVWLASAKFDRLSIDDTIVVGELQMRNLEVAQNLSLLNSELTAVELRAAKIGGGLSIEGKRRQDTVCGLRDARSRPKNYPAQFVDLTEATVGILSFGSACYGPINAVENWGAGARLILTNASVRTLKDGLCPEGGSNCPDTWPEHLELTGFIYQQLNSFDANKQSDMAARPTSWWIDWLGRQQVYSPQPYEYLASTLLKVGYKDKAEDILYAGKNRELENTSFPGNIKLWMERVLIGYGYRTRYAAMWAAGFIVLGAIVLHRSGEGPRNRMPYGVAFSFDMLLPVVKLRDYHYSIDLKGWARYYFYFHKLMGYVLASFLIAGLTGLTK
jgi:hypothetical protein